MSLQLSIPNLDSAKVIHALPDHYKGPVIRGAKVVHLRDDIKEISFQKICYEGFELRFFSGYQIKKFQIDRADTEGLFVCYMQKNGMRGKIGDVGRIHLRKGHHMLSFKTAPDNAIILDNSEEFEHLEIYYTPPLLDQLCSTFPRLGKIIVSDKEIIIGNRTFWTAPNIREIFSSLLYSEYDQSLQELYFGLKVRELLFHALQNCLGINNNALQITPYEVARIYEAKTILETYIDKKPPTIRQLSKMVALNEFKLKNGFRIFFNSGIFTWITTEKMYRAKQYLEETNKPIKEIASLAGYPRTTNFITAFRKQFGITPGAIRRS